MSHVVEIKTEILDPVAIHGKVLREVHLLKFNHPFV